MAGLAETITDGATSLSIALIERTVGLVARVMGRVDEINVGLKGILEA